MLLSVIRFAASAASTLLEILPISPVNCELCTTELCITDSIHDSTLSTIPSGSIVELLLNFLKTFPKSSDSFLLFALFVFSGAAFSFLFLAFDAVDYQYCI
jgi:hypothetical protein